MNEFELIKRYFDRPPRRALLGVGDDCALARPDPGLDLALTTDMLVEGRHFLPDAEPRALGHKALAANLSDLAAMGATPRWATLALAIPAADPAWLEAFAAGFYALAERYAVDLVGGDTTRGERRVISITAIGEVPPGMALERSRARPGDEIWVSGELGGAALGLVHPEITEAAKRLHMPEPRVELGARLRALAHAAIDISDGLASDLGHIAERSQVAAIVEYARIPRPSVFQELGAPELERDCVLSGGDDYELVFTAPPARRAALDLLAVELGLALTRVGTIEAGSGLSILDAKGKPIAHRGGFDHFGAQR
ncbi:MAG TPA: thiamine-phosphate kinase [Burkholderiales bacterium]|nr:thiamine-phosphate kinase [Burkholderiales bacterium]